MKQIVVIALCLMAPTALAEDNQCSRLPKCSDPGALTLDDPVPPKFLRGNVVNSASCIDTLVLSKEGIANWMKAGNATKGQVLKAFSGCIRTKHRIVYDCYQTRQGAPPGYCSNRNGWTARESVVTDESVEMPHTSYSTGLLALVPCSCAALQPKE